MAKEQIVQIPASMFENLLRSRAAASQAPAAIPGRAVVQAAPAASREELAAICRQAGRPDLIEQAQREGWSSDYAKAFFAGLSGRPARVMKPEPRLTGDVLKRIFEAANQHVANYTFQG